MTRAKNKNKNRKTYHGLPHSGFAGGHRVPSRVWLRASERTASARGAPQGVSKGVQRRNVLQHSVNAHLHTSDSAGLLWVRGETPTVATRPRPLVWNAPKKLPHSHRLKRPNPYQLMLDVGYEITLGGVCTCGGTVALFGHFRVVTEKLFPKMGVSGMFWWIFMWKILWLLQLSCACNNWNGCSWQFY